MQTTCKFYFMINLSTINATGRYKIPNAQIAIPNHQMLAIAMVDNAAPNIVAIPAKAKNANTVFLSVFTKARLRQTRPKR